MYKSTSSSRPAGRSSGTTTKSRHPRPSPTDTELWAVEPAAELISAELAVDDAESAWFERPNPATAAAYLSALADLADLRELYALACEVAR